jgi:hypothetical protein
MARKEGGWLIFLEKMLKNRRGENRREGKKNNERRSKGMKKEKGGDEEADIQECRKVRSMHIDRLGFALLIGFIVVFVFVAFVVVSAEYFSTKAHRLLATYPLIISTCAVPNVYFFLFCVLLSSINNVLKRPEHL